MPADLAVDAFIQVRRGSSRLPDKAFVQLADRSCIEHVVERLKSCRSLRHVVICTSTLDEDAALSEEAHRLGVLAFRGDLENCLDRFSACAEEFGTDVIVRVAGDSPLVPGDLLEDAIQTFRSSDCDYMGSHALPVGTYFEIFTLDALRRAMTAAVDPSHSADLTYFIGREEINRVCQFEPPLTLQRKDAVLALNRPEDLDVLVRVFEQAPRAGDFLTLVEALRFLDSHPEIKSINADYTPVSAASDVLIDPDRLS